MSISRHIYIYEDVESKLKEVENISALVNELLREHFNKDNIKKLTLEEIKKRKEVLKIQMEAAAKIQEVEQSGERQ